MDASNGYQDVGSGTGCEMRTDWRMTAWGQQALAVVRSKAGWAWHAQAVQEAITIANKRMRRRLRAWAASGATRRAPQRRASRAVTTRTRAASCSRRSSSKSRDDSDGSEPGSPRSTKPRRVDRHGHRANSPRVEVAR